MFSRSEDGMKSKCYVLSASKQRNKVHLRYLDVNYKNIAVDDAFSS